MRRASDGFEVAIVAPTLGQVTRISPDEIDPRAATVASNVRFEKGVAKNAMGFVTLVQSPNLESPANLIYQTQFYQPSQNVGIIGTQRKLYSLFSPSDPKHVVLTQLYDYLSNLANARSRIVATSFFDKVIFAQPRSPMVYWDGVSAAAKLLPGLDPLLAWQGVTTFRDYVLIWGGSTLKWCATGDAFEWIPVGATATSALLKTLQTFSVPAVGVKTEWVYVDSSTAALLAIGQFMRFDLNGYVTYLSVTDVLPSTGQVGNVTGFPQTVPAGGDREVFIRDFIPYKAGGMVYFSNNPSIILTVNSDAFDPGTNACTLAADFTIPAPGGNVTIQVEGLFPFGLGAHISIGPNLFAGNDVYIVTGIDYADGIVNLAYTGNSGTSLSTHFAGEFIVPQPFVSLHNASGSIDISAMGGTLQELFAFKGTVSQLTGAAPATTVVPIGTTILSVDANGAGELVNAGAFINGPLWWVETLGDYAYIFKNRSIQSIQYVGLDQGVFFLRTEVIDEGLIGKYSFVKVGIGQIFLFGNREIYRYIGGSQLQPVGRQHAVEVFAELDLTRVDEIVGYHNEKDFEVWFAYPVAGTAANDAPYRVFIYNYVEDSCTTDDYDPSAHANLVLHGITAFGRLNLSPNPTFAFAGGTWSAPVSWPVDALWEDILSSGAQNFTVAGFQHNNSVDRPTLALLNQGFDRDGNAMACLYETGDFSDGDPLSVKYSDTLTVALEAVAMAVQVNPYVIEVQLGSRMNLGDDLVWSNPVVLPIESGEQRVAKVNIRRTGRYMRIRVSSSQVGCGWRVSRMHLMGRLGGTY
jgi:hypothetical protein